MVWALVVVTVTALAEASVFLIWYWWPVTLAAVGRVTAKGAVVASARMMESVTRSMGKGRTKPVS